MTADVNFSASVFMQITNVTFVQDDMLNADVGSAGIVMLTSQCWDSDVRRLTYDKLYRELPESGLVIDYGSACEQPFGDPIICLNVEVSWNALQIICIFKKH